MLVFLMMIPCQSLRQFSGRSLSGRQEWKWQFCERGLLIHRRGGQLIHCVPDDSGCNVAGMHRINFILLKGAAGFVTFFFFPGSLLG